MFQFIEQDDLAQDMALMARCLELRAKGQRQHGASLGQTARTASPGDANDDRFAVHMIHRGDDGRVDGYARLTPRPGRSDMAWDGATTRMARLELERVSFEERDAAGREERLGKLAHAACGYARANGFTSICGYGEPAAFAALRSAGFTVSVDDPIFEAAGRKLQAFTFLVSPVKRRDSEQHGSPVQPREQLHAKPSEVPQDVLGDLDQFFHITAADCAETLNDGEARGGARSQA